MKWTTKYAPIGLCLLFSIASLSIQAQSDKIQANNSEITIIPINHATLALKWGQEVVYFDPSGSHELFKEVPKPTMILVTDIHGDHFNPTTLDRMGAKDLQVVVPPAVADKIPRAYSKVRVLSNGQSVELNGIKIEAIPMYNLPESKDSRHPKGRGNGYVVTMGAKRFYISGDTADITEMRALKDIDVAFVCMNLPYTMDVEAAASAVLDFVPGIVYPYHFRGQNGLSDVDQFKEIVEAGNEDIEVRLREWYPR